MRKRFVFLPTAAIMVGAGTIAAQACVIANVQYAEGTQVVTNCAVDQCQIVKCQNNQWQPGPFCYVPTRPPMNPPCPSAPVR
jgi:hypothetical protein